MKNESYVDNRTQIRTYLYVLIACEESQAECKAFRELGHIAYSCDIQPCRPTGNPHWHIQGDVTPYLQGVTRFVTQDGALQSVPRFDIIIAHPPCIYLSKVGCPLMVINGIVQEKRYRKMLDARDFFFTCLNAKAPYVAVENPIPMRRAQLPKPSCFIHPSWFGVKYTKKTLYWLKNLPPIMAQLDYPNPKEFVGASRGKYRSRTFPEVARAIAQQWGSYVMNELTHQVK